MQGVDSNSKKAYFKIDVKALAQSNRRATINEKFPRETDEKQARELEELRSWDLWKHCCGCALVAAVLFTVGLLIFFAVLAPSPASTSTQVTVPSSVTGTSHSPPTAPPPPPFIPTPSCLINSSYGTSIQTSHNTIAECGGSAFGNSPRDYNPNPRTTTGTSYCQGNYNRPSTPTITCDAITGICVTSGFGGVTYQSCSHALCCESCRSCKRPGYGGGCETQSALYNFRCFNDLGPGCPSLDSQCNAAGIYIGGRLGFPEEA